MTAGKVVVQNPARAPEAAVERLAGAGVATVSEANGRRGILHPEMRPVWAGAHTAGTAVTALCHPGDNLMIHVAVEQYAPGDLLVVAVTSPCRDGSSVNYWLPRFRPVASPGWSSMRVCATSPTFTRWAFRCGLEACRRTAP